MKNEILNKRVALSVILQERSNIYCFWRDSMQRKYMAWYKNERILYNLLWLIKLQNIFSSIVCVKVEHCKKKEENSSLFNLSLLNNDKQSIWSSFINCLIMEEFGSPKKWSRVKETLKKAPVWHKSIRNIVAP